MPPGFPSHDVIAPRSERRLARIALFLLLLLVAAVITVLVRSRGLLIVLLLALIIAVIVIAATSWWAFTTYRTWKRWLNLVVAVVTAGMAVFFLIGFSLTFAAGMFAIGALTVAYAETARQVLQHADALAPRDPRTDGSWPMRPWLLVNSWSGGGKALRLGLIDAAHARGIDVHVLQRGEDPSELAKSAVTAGADAVGAAAGDGTLATVAAVAVESRVPFMCVPTGTRNHFAADLGLDRARPLAALDAVDASRGRKGSVDVGVVNGRLFLNNVSLGAYADLVSEPGYRENKLGIARAVLPQTFRREREPLQVAVRLPDGRSYADAVVVFVANNPYSPSPLESGARPRLDSGLLQVSILRARTGRELASVLTSGRRGTVGEATWAQWTTPTLVVESVQPELAAGIDGESVKLVTPLQFRVLPRALQVLLPRAPRPRRRLEMMAPFRRHALGTLWRLARSDLHA
jgi:diacylglycerol kinase family enzyme